ncbi:MAG: DUF2203 domain-containing protein [Terriglobales bacterium]
MDRTFTLDEANALLPVLETLLRGAIRNRKRVEELQKEVQELQHRVFLSGGALLNIGDLIAHRAEMERVTKDIQDKLQEIAAMGVQVKDLDIGLLDFPCIVGGEIVLLCWKLGESSITHWHTVSDGFKGRRPIDARIPRSGRQPS